MSYSEDSSLFFEAMGDNVFGKRSSNGIKQTKGFLKRLYVFDLDYPKFVVFRHFWHLAESKDKPQIALLFALSQDDLLVESIQVIQSVKPGDKAKIEFFEENIERYHPSQYTFNTKRSTAQNLASSWKQAGFIEGKVKNIRVQPIISPWVGCFAFLLAYLNGERGDFIWNSTSVRALCLPESMLRDLAIECAKKDLMQYQFAGSVTSIRFTTLLNKMGLDGNTY